MNISTIVRLFLVGFFFFFFFSITFCKIETIFMEIYAMRQFSFQLQCSQKHSTHISGAKNMSIRQSLSIVFLFLLISFLFFGCQSGTETEEFSFGAAGEKPTINIVKFDQINEYFDLSGASASESAIQPITDAEIPPRWQYTDEELEVVKEKYKRLPDIEVNPANSVKIECKNCAVLLDGILMASPFYLEYKKDVMYLNGYQCEPPKSGIDLYPAIYSENFKKSDIPDLDERCINEKKIVRNIVNDASKNSRSDEWIRQQFSNEKINIDYITNDKINVVVGVSSKCGYEGHYNIGSAKKLEKIMKKKASNISISKIYTSFKNVLKDDTLWIYDEAIVPISDLSFIEKICKSQMLIEQAKLFRLEKNLFSRSMVLYWYANIYQ